MGNGDGEIRPHFFIINSIMIKRFSQFINEALVTFGNKAYPKYGHVVILAGGAGSGKGYVIQNLLGISAKIIDVDSVKQLALKTDKIIQKVKEITGEDISKFNFKNPEHVKRIHVALSDILGVIPALQSTINKAIAQGNPDRLPNLIFDVTLKDFRKFENICKMVELMGYEKENIHLVWVINDVDVALKQNKERDRIVPDDILIDTHVGAAKTLKQIVSLTDDLKSYLNGDIWFVFNNREEADSTIRKSSTGGSFVDKANYIKLKKAGSSTISQIPKEFIYKIQQYTKNNF